MRHENDKSNISQYGFIPDVLNLTYKYIIEIDGDVHSLPNVKKRDERKNKKFSKEGFTVFRIKAYNYLHLELLIDEISKLRNRHDKIQSQKIIHKDKIWQRNLK